MRGLVICTAAVVLLACSDTAETPPAPAPEAPASVAEADSGPDRASLRKRAIESIGALPSNADSRANPYSAAKAELGRMLFYDARLSKNHDVSCNSCHPLDRFGQDGQATSPGHKGQRGARSSPSVYNAALHIAQFWDGRAADVEAQAKGPVLNPIEMAMPDEGAVLAVLASIPEYVEAFSAAFPTADPSLSYDNMARAIGAFERRLVTPGVFDVFLDGDDAVLSDAAARGLATFLEVGCVGCHSGPAVGGNGYQKLGLLRPYQTEDPGRFALTGKESDRNVFKVPSLRNIAETAPYFHDGTIPTLDAAVRLMAEHQLGKELNDEQVRDLLEFLESLTGRPDPEYTAKPELPASTEKTPVPDPT